MNEDDENVENAMSLSFLDVISCGMVSSIFLAIIFSVIGNIPAISLKTDDFIAVVLELNDEPAKPDNDNNQYLDNIYSDNYNPDGVNNNIDNRDLQVWNLALKRPGDLSGKFECLDMSHYNLTTGRYVESNTVSEDDINLKIQLFGFNSAFYSGKSAGKFRIFFISRPEHGKWTMKIFPRANSSIDPKFKQLKKIMVLTSNKTDPLIYDYADPSKSKKDVWTPDTFDVNRMTCTFEF